MTEQNVTIMVKGVVLDRLIEDMERTTESVKKLRDWIDEENRQNTAAAKKIRAMFPLEPMTREEQAVLGFIQDRGRVSRTELSQKFMGRFRANDLDRITEKLRGLDLLAFTDGPRTTKPVLVYVYVGP